MSKRITLEEEIDKFLDVWDCRQNTSFLTSIIPILKLYDVDEEDDWVMEEVGKENLRNVRLLRTIYLVSRLCEFHAGKLLRINSEFKHLWKRMEKESVGQQ